MELDRVWDEKLPMRGFVVETFVMTDVRARIRGRIHYGLGVSRRTTGSHSATSLTQNRQHRIRDQ